MTKSEVERSLYEFAADWATTRGFRLGDGAESYFRNAAATAARDIVGHVEGQVPRRDIASGK